MTELLVANPALVFTEENDGGLLYNPATEEICILNETGAFVFAYLQQKHSETELLQALQEHFDIDPNSTPVQDLQEFLNQLKIKQSIVPATS